MSRRLGAGGEAEVFAATDDDSVVAKIYKLPTPQREQKLRAMLENPPTDPTLEAGHRSICWPQTLIYDKGGFAGFLMSRIDFARSRPLLAFYNPTSRQRISVEITWQYLVRAAMNVCSVVEAIHSQGHVIGDLNESNFLVSNSALVTLVDCDSIQVQEKASGLRHRCPVGKLEYTPPELQGHDLAKVDREPAHDYFALGIVIFLLLMEGVHPFMGNWTGYGHIPPIDELIKGGFFPYVRGSPLTPSPVAPPFEILPRTMRALFERCFATGHQAPQERPVPSEWQYALRQLDGALQICKLNTHHIFSAHLSSCPWCERMRRFDGFDPFPLQAGIAVKPRPRRPRIHIPALNQSVVQPPAASLKSELRLAFLLLIAGIVAGTAGLLLFSSGYLVLPWARGTSGSALTAQETKAVEAVDLDTTSTAKLRIEQLILCQSVDRAGNPVGQAVRFGEEDVRARGLLVYLRYSSAVPDKTTVQAKWTSPAYSGSSQLYRLRDHSASVVLPLGKKFVPGSYRVTIWIDGSASRSANLTVDPELVVMQDPAGGKEQSAHDGPPHANAMEAKPPVSPATQPPAAPAKVTTIRYAAKHKHRLGSCDGILTLTSDSISFESAEHPFTFTRESVHLDDDGITDSTGKKWHFWMKDADVRTLLRQWKDSALFQRD